MLQDIRQASQSGWTYILVGVLIVVFAVFFGAPLDSCGGQTNRVLMAKVGGTNLYTDDLNVIFNRYYGNRRSVDDATVVKQQAASLRALILIHLLSQKAEDAGLRVDDAEFEGYVKDFMRNPDFRAYSQAGKFDGPMYKNMVQYGFRVSIPKYEDFKRRELLARKYVETLEMQYQATPWEVEELHQLRNETVNLEFVKLDPEAIKANLNVTDEDVQAFLTTKASDVKAYYDTNKADYEDPAQIRIRRIFILKPGEAEGDDARDAAKKRFETAKKRVETEDFATVAGELTEDYAKEKQGLMDWSTLENLDQNIADALKGAKKGDVKDVETSFAYMLVKLEDEKAAKTEAFADVQNDIARKLLQDTKVDAEITKLADAIRAKMTGSESLETAVNALKEENKPAELAEGEEAPASVWDAVKTAKTGAFGKEGQDLSALFQSPIPGLGRSPWDRVPGIGKSPELARDAFTLTKEKPVSAKVYTVGEARFLVRLHERQDATPEKLEETRESLEMEIRGTKIGASLGPWMAIFGAGVPMEEYGPALEALLAQAQAKKELKLYPKNHDAAAVLQIGDAPAPVIAPEADAKEAPAKKDA